MATAPLKTALDVPNSQRRPMTREESEIFIRCSIGQQGGKEQALTATALLGEFEKAGQPLALRIMVQRLAFADSSLRSAPLTVIFLTSLCGTPAKVVLWAHYLVRRTYEMDGAVVDNDALAHDFPMGFPTDEGMSAIWDAQKREDAPGGNTLNMAWPWKRDLAEAA